ncbi:MAG: hypothetical protein V4538_15415 [Bacteroidota bacterium]
MKQVTNLNERTQYFASDNLLSELQSKIKENDIIVNFAFTDYGGDFFDKVCCKYFAENNPDNFIKESTYYYGENGFLFGEVAREFLEVTENYLLGFNDIESFYCEMENEEREAGIKFFIEGLDTDKYEISAEIPSDFYEYVEDYCNVLTSGLDYSESDMIDKAIETGLIKELATT